MICTNMRSDSLFLAFGMPEVPIFFPHSSSSPPAGILAYELKAGLRLDTWNIETYGYSN